MLISRSSTSSLLRATNESGGVVYHKVRWISLQCVSASSIRYSIQHSRAEQSSRPYWILEGAAYQVYSWTLKQRLFFGSLQSLRVRVWRFPPSIGNAYTFSPVDNTQSRRFKESPAFLHCPRVFPFASITLCNYEVGYSTR